MLNLLLQKNSGKHFVGKKNVKCVKWVENMEDVYSQVRAVIRLPLHDATGATIIETLSMGRTMIASATDFPHCKIVHNFDDAKKFLREALDNPILNTEGSDYVHKYYDNSKLTDELINICKKLVDNERIL